MKLDDFDYNLPDELIATYPAHPRDSSRLLVLDKDTGEIQHRRFFDIVDYLNEGDCLVLNNSRVIPARLMGQKVKTGGGIEIFLHKMVGDGTWECLLGGKRIQLGMEVEFTKSSLVAKILENNQDGTWRVEFNLIGKDFSDELERIGKVPLPPYIEKQRREFSSPKVDDRTEYQTVYADEERNGSVAAPTAGLHFTPELLQKIRDKGVRIEYITLHVGMGTFAPVKVDDIRTHKMHAELVEIDKETITRLLQVKQDGGRIITVGTTSTRAVEAMAREFSIFNDQFSIKDQTSIKNLIRRGGKNYCKEVDIFIYPGYEFQLVDSMITNFHLPKSTLLMLVAALAGKDHMDEAYRVAIREGYRFYSYGDAMIVK